MARGLMTVLVCCIDMTCYTYMSTIRAPDGLQTRIQTILIVKDPGEVKKSDQLRITTAKDLEGPQKSMFNNLKDPVTSAGL